VSRVRVLQGSVEWAQGIFDRLEDSEWAMHLDWPRNVIAAVVAEINGDVLHLPPVLQLHLASQDITPQATILTPTWRLFFVFFMTVYDDQQKFIPETGRRKNVWKGRWLRAMQQKNTLGLMDRLLMTFSGDFDQTTWGSRGTKSLVVEISKSDQLPSSRGYQSYPLQQSVCQRRLHSFGPLRDLTFLFQLSMTLPPGRWRSSTGKQGSWNPDGGWCYVLLVSSIHSFNSLSICKVTSTQSLKVSHKMNRRIPAHSIYSPRASSLPVQHSSEVCLLAQTKPVFIHSLSGHIQEEESVTRPCPACLIDRWLPDPFRVTPNSHGNLCNCRIELTEDRFGSKWVTTFRFQYLIPWL